MSFFMEGAPMTQKQSFTFESYSPGNIVAGKRWLPDDATPIRAVLQIHHGMAEYIDRYDEFARALNERGIAVVGTDHLGHGDTAPLEEQRGYFGPRMEKTLLVEDMHHLTQLIKEDYPDVPHVIFGHSMGSFLVREFLTKYGSSVDAAIVCGTGETTGPLLPAAQAMVRILTFVQGERARSLYVTRLMFGQYNERFKPTRTPYDWLTRDEHIVDDYIEKDATGFTFTLNAFSHMLRNVTYVNSQRAIDATPSTMPLLLMSGAEDPVGEYGIGVQRLAKRLRRAGLRDITLKLYEHGRHEIINELDRAQVYSDVADWIESQVVR